MRKWFSVRTFSVASCLVLQVACSSDDPAPATDPTLGGAGAAGGSTPAAGGGGGPAGAGAVTAGTPARPTTGAAGSGAQPGGAAGTPATPMGGPTQPAAGGAPGAPGAMMMPTTPAGTPAPLMECNGKPLPPRAQSQQRSGFKVGPESAGMAPYWPTMGWKMEAPDKLGFDAAKLDTAVNFEISGSNSQAVMVVRHGYVAVEQYFGGYSATQQHESYSMAKSFTSAVTGIAIGEGKLKSTDELLCASYPMQWDCSDTNDPRSRIKIDHAMNLMTGLEWHEDWRSNSTQNDTLSAGFDMVGTVLAREAVEEPGTRKRYSTGDPALMTGPIQQGTGMTALAYAKSKIFDVIGTPNIQWGTDSAGRTTTYAGLQATAAEFAKFGYLYLNRGLWDGKQVIPAEWVDRTTIATKPCDDWNQWLWHVNMPTRLSPQDPSCEDIFCAATDYIDLPGDGYFAEGINGQFVFVIPSLDIVAVRLGNDGSGSENWDSWARGFLLALVDSVVP